MSEKSQEHFLEMVRTHQGIIHQLASLYADGQEERKDIYQEVLYQAWKSWPKFRGDAAFSTWLYRLALNTILTLQRAKRPMAVLEQAPDTAVEEHLHLEDKERLHAAIKHLADMDKALISLHLEGYSNPEIASILGMGENNVAVRLHRAKQQLSQKLKRV
ncbi:MAG: sigma-70 family RNA polymerase sigma factor [Chitinophagales bacterium]|nr:sigma-70 family RNA polymerase sigma factor [Chitinophagales bacterium]